MQPTDRRTLIARNLGCSAPYSRQAERSIDRFQDLMGAIDSLDPAERARLLSEIMVQVSGKLAQIHGAR
jgi:hypothetical protein